MNVVVCAHTRSRDGGSASFLDIRSIVREEVSNSLLRDLCHLYDVLDGHDGGTVVLLADTSSGAGLDGRRILC